MPLHHTATLISSVDWDLDETVDLAVGDNTIEVVVTSEDGTVEQTYQVLVHRRYPPERDGPRVVVAASKYVENRRGGPDQGGYRERDIYVTLYNLESDATWGTGYEYYGDSNTLDYVHRTDILGPDGNSNLAHLDLRNDCEGPPLWERNHIYMGVDREIRKVNENPENRGGGVIDTGGCAGEFKVTVTLWTGAAYEAAYAEAHAEEYEEEAREAYEEEARAILGKTTHAAQLTCHFDGSGNDDFREPADDGDGDPQKGTDWYYRGYVLCTDADGDSAPDPAPTIPALNWEPPEED